MADLTPASSSRSLLEPLGIKLQARRLSDQLADRLREQIEAGVWLPNERIPTEARLCEQHSVSRSVVREAVHQLRSQGLLQSRQGSGMYVVPQRHRAWQPDLSLLGSIQGVVQMMELRRVVESGMAPLAAERAKAAQIKTLWKALKAIDDATDSGRDGVAEDFAFHRAIAEASNNTQFVRLIGFLEQYLLDAMRVTKHNEARSSDFMQQVRNEHRAIVQAIADRNPEAARQAATTHMELGQWRLGEGGWLKSKSKNKLKPKPNTKSKGSPS